MYCHLALDVNEMFCSLNLRCSFLDLERNDTVCEVSFCYNSDWFWHLLGWVDVYWHLQLYIHLRKIILSNHLLIRQALPWKSFNDISLSLEARFSVKS